MAVSFRSFASMSTESNAPDNPHVPFSCRERLQVNHIFGLDPSRKSWWRGCWRVISCSLEKDNCRETCPTTLGVVEESDESGTDGCLKVGRPWSLWLYKLIIEGQDASLKCYVRKVQSGRMWSWEHASWVKRHVFSGHESMHKAVLMDA